MSSLLQLQLDEAKKEYAAATSRYNNMRALSIGSMVAGILFGVLFGLAVMRNITRSLKEAVDAADAVAHGDLSRAIPVHG